MAVKLIILLSFFAHAGLTLKTDAKFAHFKPMGIQAEDPLRAESACNFFRATMLHWNKLSMLRLRGGIFDVFADKSECHFPKSQHKS
jgi:hypothetical protein